MSLLEASIHALAGTIGGIIAFTAVYPLENIRTRMQVQVKQREAAQAQLQTESKSTSQVDTPTSPTAAKVHLTESQLRDQLKVTSEDEYISAWDCVKKTIRKEGWQGLYSGLVSGVVGVGISSAIYFWWYLWLKRMVLRRTGTTTLSPLWNVVVAALSGVINITLTSPIWVINTRMTLQSSKQKESAGNPSSSTSSAQEAPYKGVLDACLRIAREEGFQGLYRGYLASVVLVSNPAIQFVLYEQLMTRLSQRRARAAVSALAALSTVATSVAIVARDVGASAATPASSTRASTQTSPNAAATAAAAASGESRALVTPWETFSISAFAKLIATVVTYPYLVVKSRQQADRGNTDKAPSLLATMATMLKKEGWRAFYSGLDAKLLQTVTNAALSFMIYERMVIVVRYLMGRLLHQRK